MAIVYDSLPDDPTPDVVAMNCSRCGATLKRVPLSVVEAWRCPSHTPEGKPLTYFWPCAACSPARANGRAKL